ncbi:MAG: glycine zipper 2TM domain-containing protein, partial [Alphaproteobacteria bacterium]|nr:glycine zipper 2TM domain-containing protein [Alphaproteobacteria bacterium]
MRKRLLTAVLIVGVAFCGATPVVANENTFFGTGIGAALGGLLGSQFGHGDARLAYTGLGVFTGGVIGNSIGTSMDRADTAYYSGPSYGYEPAYVGTAYYEPTYVAP